MSIEVTTIELLLAAAKTKRTMWRTENIWQHNYLPSDLLVIRGELLHIFNARGKLFNWNKL
jgi:hypothetical protein